MECTIYEHLSVKSLVYDLLVLLFSLPAKNPVRRTLAHTARAQLDAKTTPIPVYNIIFVQMITDHPNENERGLLGFQVGTDVGLLGRTDATNYFSGSFHPLFDFRTTARICRKRLLNCWRPFDSRDRFVFEKYQSVVAQNI